MTQHARASGSVRLRTGPWIAVAAAAVAACASWRASWGPAPTYNAHIRPILADNCFACHGPDAAQRKAELRLDKRDEAIAAGAIVPGDAKGSPLVRRIRSEDRDELMPPPSTHKVLDEAQRATLERWIEAGATYEEHWAFVAPEAVPLPADANPVDALVEPRLAREGLEPSPAASRETLLRRVTLDLVGLPPTIEEQEAFLADRAPGAYERVVERLLASPRYGERMALPWLDAARYADSNGFQQDGDTFQWKWRDWLVERLNADTPFDRLSTEMLAGDLLPDATDDTRLGTAFLRNHLLNGEGGAIPEEQRYVSLFDRVDTTATTWLGLTIACAQCHDHKYDPTTQRDYYALLDAFNRVPEKGTVDGAASRFRVAPPLLERPDEAQRERRADLERRIAELGDAESAKAERDRLRGELDWFLQDEWPRVMVMSDAAPRETRVLSRGDYLAPGEVVAFATPAFLPPLPADAPQNRLGLARWLFAPENPLVARVAVNRAWQLFFGEGLVATPEDHGVQGEPPAQPELLDTLAVRWRDDGWSSKQLHRWIVLSKAYRRSSVATARQLELDPRNRLLARQTPRRLPAMLLRDLALASSGLLDPRIGGAPVYPYQPAGVWDSLAITRERDFAYPASSGSDLHRRSLYTFWRRTIAPANMFDASPRQSCRVRETTTASPLHALTMLNDPTWTEAARALAQTAHAHGADDRQRLAWAFRAVLSRRPTTKEIELLAGLAAEQRRILAGDADAAQALASVGASPRDERLDPSEHAALAQACLALYNLDEAMVRD